MKTTRLVKAPAERLLFYQLAFSVPVLAVAIPLFGPVRIVDPAPVVLAALAFQILVVGITYLTRFWLIRMYPAAPLASFTFLTPALRRGGGGAAPGGARHARARPRGGAGGGRPLPRQPSAAVTRMRPSPPSG